MIFDTCVDPRCDVVYCAIHSCFISTDNASQSISYRIADWRHVCWHIKWHCATVLPPRAANWPTLQVGQFATLMRTSYRPAARRDRAISVRWRSRNDAHKHGCSIARTHTRTHAPTYIRALVVAGLKNMHRIGSYKSTFTKTFSVLSDIFKKTALISWFSGRRFQPFF